MQRPCPAQTHLYRPAAPGCHRDWPRTRPGCEHLRGPSAPEGARRDLRVSHETAPDRNGACACPGGGAWNRQEPRAMVIAFYEIAEEWGRTLGPARHARVRVAASCRRQRAPRDAEAVSVFIRSRVDRRCWTSRGCGSWRRAPRGSTTSTCRVPREGIRSPIPHYGENTVARHVRLIWPCRGDPRANRRTRAGVHAGGPEGMDLRGKLLGDRRRLDRAARDHIARAFGMHVVAYDIAPQPLIAEVLGFRYVSLIDLLGAVEVLTLHAATPETHHLMNRERFAALRRGALFRTRRGARWWTPRRCCGRWTRASSQAPRWTCWKARSSSRRSRACSARRSPSRGCVSSWRGAGCWSVTT